MLVMGGIHGNEPGGVRAVISVLARLQEQATGIRGRFVAVAGNLGALESDQRFLARDLNRQWLPANVAALRSRESVSDNEEDREQRELVEVFEKFIGESRGPLLFVDLHTCSSEGPPFTCFSDTLTNLRIARAIPIPVILGLEEAIDGAVLDFFNERGLPCIAVEGGKHDHPATADHLEAALWILLVQAGCLRPAEVPDLDRYRHRLAIAAGGCQGTLEIRDHHRITPEDRFVMEPGFQSLDGVRKGQLLAHDAGGEIRATESGRVLLPLYQEEGEDGFFLTRRVTGYWLRVAMLARRLRLDKLLPLFPGVSRHPSRAETFLVSRRIARWPLVGCLHLLGFRRRRPEGDHWTFSRRRTALSSRALPWESPGRDE